MSDENSYLKTYKEMKERKAQKILQPALNILQRGILNNIFDGLRTIFNDEEINPDKEKKMFSCNDVIDILNAFEQMLLKNLDNQS